MRIGIFGGSFNPPHNMHIDLNNKLINENYIDKVIFVPTGTKYKYKNNLLSDEIRFEMLKLATKKYSEFSVSDFELKDEVVYTFETMRYFKELYPEDTLYFICGTDNLSYMDKWQNGDEILSNYKILAIPRNEDNVDEILKSLKKYQHNIIIAQVLVEPLSSTQIREIIKNDQDTSNYLDASVIKYIKERKLYK